LVLFAICLALWPADRAHAADHVIAPVPNVSRGFYNAPLVVELSTITPGALIRYTLDGTPPTPQNGTLYTGPIPVNTTTVLSALAFLPDGSLPPSPVTTHTYIFLLDVVQRLGVPPGYPEKWSLYLDGNVARYSADYEMDPEIVNDPAYTDDLFQGLIDIPTVSLVMDKDALFDNDYGIYQRSLEEGPEWERPVSAELIYPDGRSGFQINAGIRIMGGDSRYAHKAPKHSFRLLFKRDYGPPKLEFPLFADDASPIEPTDEFDTLVLRAGYNNTWIHRTYSQRLAGQYVHDQWMRDTQLAMGQPSGHGIFVHLYINGIYWGLYNLHERPSAPFMADYFGGEKEEYDVLNSGEAVDGDTLAWQQMMNIVLGGLSDAGSYQAIQQYLDVENLADYMILNHYGGNVDWDLKNWYAGRRRVPGAGFKFMSWDAEKTLGAVDEDTSDTLRPNSPTEVFYALMENAEFRTLFADRVHRHTSEGGALTPAATAQRYRELTDQIYNAVVAESARWGDYRRDVHQFETGPYELYTRDGHWLPERNRLLNLYFPERTSETLDKYDNRDFYPEIEPPVINPDGGNLENDGTVRLLNPNASGEIWYTLDGSDPRPPYDLDAPLGINGGNGAVIPLTASTRLRARVYADGEWSALHEAEFFTPPAANLSDLRITELMYDPPGGAQYEFIEIHNAGETVLDVGGVRFTDGIDYALPAGARLAAGAYMVIARNPASFQERYGFAPFNRTGYRGKLSNDGERIVLSNSQGVELLDVQFISHAADAVLADGAGYSLTLRVADAAPARAPADWRVSAAWGGSPRAADPPPNYAVRPVLVNEVLAGAATPEERYVELYNPTPDPVNIGGWYLSDDPELPTQYRIPNGTRMVGHGYAVFSETELGFPLRADAGVYLFAADAAGHLSGHAHGFALSATDADVSLGRCIIQPPEADDQVVEHFVAQRSPTRDQPNARPHVSSVVISEMMYNPQRGHEFIELVNLASTPVPLYDVAHPQHTWRITGVGDFDLPPGIDLPPGSVLLVVPTDPSTFRAAHDIADDVIVAGPYAGQLDNGGERVAVLRPGPPDRSGVVPYIQVDAVTYGDEDAWPDEADGAGASLERIELDEFGDSWLNWAASRAIGGTPGVVSTAMRAAGADAQATSRILLPLVIDQRLAPQNNHCFIEVPD
jgi:hypothetical protein